MEYYYCDSTKLCYPKHHLIAQENSYLFMGQCLIIPEKFRNRILELLHYQHLGIERMKSMLRLWYWWPNAEPELGAYLASYVPCDKHRQKLVLYISITLGKKVDRIHLSNG